ncbi:hypothetical protein [Undibacterium sp. WLHG33]
MLLAICLSLFRLYSDVMQGDNFAEESQGGAAAVEVPDTGAA